MDLFNVNRISEKSYIVGDNKTSLIDNNIIYVIAKGEQTDELAEKQSEINHVLAKLAGGKINYLVNLNDCGKNSPKARNVWTELSDEEITNKVAIFGMHPVAKVLASFVLKVTKKNNQKFFSTKQEAMRWLKEL